MKRLVNTIIIMFLLLHFGVSAQSDSRVISRQGQVSFFSYTSVENIEATNNLVSSIIETSSNKIVVDMLMRAFVFKKALMEEHFNESYVESDIYPKLTFVGEIIAFEAKTKGPQTKIIKGIMDFHGIKKEIEFKTKIENLNGNYVLEGDFEVSVSDFNIKIPSLLAPNIAKEIKVMFRFEYIPYE
ncbi:YceI family protein [uncultured Croceitalea sp.]|uniref:YceI family protein n=1 Tax=uncultured Croceitalea sp. TaxID=1798908 RepID=UPI00374F81CF